MYKKTFFLFSIISVLLLVSCSSNNSNDNTSSNSNDSGEIKMMSNVAGGKNPNEDELFAEEIEDKTDLQVEFVHPASDYDKKLLSALGAGEEYDVVYTTLPNLNKLNEEGALTPLNDKVKESDILSDESVVPTEFWDDIKTSDGEIYGVPVKESGGSLPIVREDWMDELDLEQPETLEEFYDVLKAFKEEDPNDSGEDDTYGLTLSELHDIQPFMSAEGVKDGYIKEDDKRIIPYATEAAVPVYDWLHKLYKEDILDKNFATNSTEDARNVFLSDKAGMFVYWDAWVSQLNELANEDDKTDFNAQGIPGAIGPDDEIMLTKGDPAMWSIPKNAPNPDSAFKFLEWWNTEEGQKLGSIGIEGHDYEEKNEKISLTETGEEHNLDHGAPHSLNSNWEIPVGEQKGYENAANITDEYSEIRVTGTNWDDAEDIVWHYGELAIQGDISSEEAVKSMQEELANKDLID